MTHDPKFVKAIHRAYEQIAREDFSAALCTFVQTGYLPSKAVKRFMNGAPAQMQLALIHGFKTHCMSGLGKENLFERSLNLSLYLSVCAMQSVVRYFREKQSLLRELENFGIPLPLVLVQTMCEVEANIKGGIPHEKFIASGFTRVHLHVEYSKYTHPELDFVLVVHTHRQEVKRLRRSFHNAVRVDPTFVPPSTHEGWLAMGFLPALLENCRVYYLRVNANGDEEGRVMTYPSNKIASYYFRFGSLPDGMKVE
jgi:hypothetical protein